jgi:outer membrane protein OmpA-like peptidoglycan-associated protein
MFRRYIIFLTFFLPGTVLFCQQETYSVAKASFSSEMYDEFCPVYYKNGIVFCTNRTKNDLTAYSDTKDKGQFKIFYTDTLSTAGWQQSGIFSRELSSRLNDGPATFNHNGDTVYFSRNILIEGPASKLSGAKNKLGLFSAVFDGRKWSRIKDFRFNNEWYNITAPCLSPDGLRLYFASDKPGGLGGADLYYCEWKEGYWHNPVNLGPRINTPGNEAYPFVDRSGGLYFSSDGPQGLGGKDIYYTKMKNNEWQTPVRLDPPINSSADDFGLVTDDLMNEGYFSTKRGNTADIYRFKTNFPQFFYSEVQIENQHCFTFRDTGNTVAGNNAFQYKWSFGDGTSAIGQVVNHCLPGPGKYPVRLDIVDKKSGTKFFTKLAYNLDLKDVEQPYIYSPVSGVKGSPLMFDATKSNLPGCKILDYIWDMGDSTRERGESVKHVYKKPGAYKVQLGIAVTSESTGISQWLCTRKTVVIFQDEKQKLSEASKLSGQASVPELNGYSHAVIDTVYSSDLDLSKDAVFAVELLSSKTALDLKSSKFKKVPARYAVREMFDQNRKSYSYLVDSKLDLTGTWMTFIEMKALGFDSTRVRTVILTDQAEKELYRIKKIYGLAASSYFDNNNRLTSTAYLLMDQLARFLEKYPDQNLLIEIYSDMADQSYGIQDITQVRAQLISNYLQSKRIDSKRLSTKGLGWSLPVTYGQTESEKNQNRRVDIRLVK